MSCCLILLFGVCDHKYRLVCSLQLATVSVNSSVTVKNGTSKGKIVVESSESVSEESESEESCSETGGIKKRKKKKKKKKSSESVTEDSSSSETGGSKKRKKKEKNLFSKIVTLEMYTAYLQSVNITEIIDSMVEEPELLNQPKADPHTARYLAYAEVLVKIMEARVGEFDHVDDNKVFLLNLTESSMKDNVRFIWISEYIRKRLVNPGDFAIYLKTNTEPKRCFHLINGNYTKRCSIRDAATRQYNKFIIHDIFLQYRAEAINKSNIIGLKLLDKRTNLPVVSLPSSSLDEHVLTDVLQAGESGESGESSVAALSDAQKIELVEKVAGALDMVEKGKVIADVLKSIQSGNIAELIYNLPTQHSNSDATQICGDHGDINLYIFSCFEFFDTKIEQIYLFAKKDMTIESEKQTLILLLNDLCACCLVLKIGYFTEQLTKVTYI